MSELGRMERIPERALRMVWENHAVLHDNQDPPSHSDYQAGEHHGFRSVNPGLAILFAA